MTTTTRLLSSHLKTQITPRERQVLHMIAHEYSAKEIAQQLFISCETVHSHRKNLKRKLNASNIAGLVRIGFELGLLQLQYNVAI